VPPFGKRLTRFDGNGGEKCGQWTKQGSTKKEGGARKRKNSRWMGLKKNSKKKKGIPRSNKLFWIHKPKGRRKRLSIWDQRKGTITQGYEKEVEQDLWMEKGYASVPDFGQMMAGGKRGGMKILMKQNQINPGPKHKGNNKRMKHSSTSNESTAIGTRASQKDKRKKR